MKTLVDRCSFEEEDEEDDTNTNKMTDVMKLYSILNEGKVQIKTHLLLGKKMKKNIAFSANEFLDNFTLFEKEHYLYTDQNEEKMTPILKQISMVNPKRLI